MKQSIGGGQSNCIDSTLPAPSSFGTIGGGHSNKICKGVHHGSIFGGNGNTVAGSCSAILGGSGNSDGGLPFMGMYGTGLTALVIPSGLGAFWANELVVPNIPIGSLFGGIPVPPGGYPAGSLWYYPDVNGNKVVYAV